NNAMPLPCEAWAEKLATARLATLSLHEDDALKSHLESCEACAAVQREYDEMDKLIGKITCTRTLTALPPQLLQLWEEQNRQIALHTLAVQRSEPSKTVALGTSSHLSVPTSQVALATLSIP